MKLEPSGILMIPEYILQLHTFWKNSVKDKYIQPLYMLMYTNLKSIDIEHCTMKPHKEDKLPVHIRKPH